MSYKRQGYSLKSEESEISAPLMSHELTTLVQDEVAFLRDQLANCAKLLKCSLKANRPFDSKMRGKVTDAITRLETVLDARERNLDHEQ